jgi:membrane fusion protein (multidrug efflux system)
MRTKIIIAFIGSLLLASCGSGQKKTTTDPAEMAEPVETMLLQTQSIARSVQYTANLLAIEEIHYAPASPGRIEAIPVEVGSRVKKGDLLVQMDRTQLLQAEIQLQTLENDFLRFDTLRKVGSIAIQQYDQIKSQLDVLRTNVAFLRQNTQLRAPFSGVISGKYFEAGEMYSGAPLPSLGKAAILSLVQIEKLKAIVAVSERYFPMIRKGMEAAVHSDIYPDQQFSGKVFNIYPTIDPMSRSFNIEVAIDNQSGLLRPGMFSRVTLDLDKDLALLLPANAILKLQGSNDRYLFVEKEGTAVRIPVEVGKRYNDQVEVFSEQLKEGDRVIVSGQSRLLDGMKVQVVKSRN